MSASVATGDSESPGTDAQLMMRVQHGDVGAFNEPYRRYSARAYKVARAVCRDSGRAEDAVQEAFVALWRGRAAYRPQSGTLAAWLLTIVRHRAIDVPHHHDRHAGRRAEEERLLTHAAQDDVHEHVFALARAEHVRELLRRLPDAQHEVIVLAFYGQISLGESMDATRS